MTLIELFTAIANAIRAKLGTSEPISAEDFATEITGIPTGNLTNEEYQEANNDLDNILENTTVATIYPPNWSQIGYSNTPDSLLEHFQYAKSIYDNWENVSNLQRKFASDANLVYFPLVDTSNATNMIYMFQTCSELEFVPLINTINVTNMAGVFMSCKKLREIPQLNTSSVTNMNNAFSGCQNLSDSSLNNIMGMCINATNYTQSKTLKAMAISSTQATTCQSLNNYQSFLAAGWTTGY